MTFVQDDAAYSDTSEFVAQLLHLSMTFFADVIQVWSFFRLTMPYSATATQHQDWHGQCCHWSVEESCRLAVVNEDQVSNGTARGTCSPRASPEL